jgi:DNA-binding PadR family transcriptional regulator
MYYVRNRYIHSGYIVEKTDMPDQSLNSSNQPLTPAVFHILLALADGEKHGYAIMKDVETQTSGQIKMGPGTLYGSIKRMLAGGLIEETDERPDPALDDERRRYYRLTIQGQTVVAAESRRLALAVKVAQQKKVLSYNEGGIL